MRVLKRTTIIELKLIAEVENNGEIFNPREQKHPAATGIMKKL